jgi:hypothetical protein
MKNLYLIPTEKPSRLIIQNGNKLVLGNEDYSIIENRQHIYITSDEEIKEGEYYLSWQDYYNPPKYVIYVKSNGVNGDGKKIILTTDSDLIVNGVQPIDNEFLQWFVNNPSCEWVETFIDTMGCSLENCDANPCVNYKISIPKEEPKQETLEEFALRSSKYANHSNINIQKQEAIILGAKWQQENILQLLKDNDYQDEPVFELLTEQFKNK